MTIFKIMKILIILWFALLASIFVKAQSTEDYIAEHVGYAQELMHEHEMPASIILAVAIHESAAGKSKIARYLNNHFGIKGKNTNTEISSAYRDYPTVDSSYRHFVDFLRSRTYFNVLFDKYDQYDYKNWANGFQLGGYAASKTWATQIIGLINKYELYQYDERPDDYVENVIESIELAATPTPNTFLAKKKSKYYTVKKGDNLSKIAKKNGTTATAIMKKNGLKSVSLQPGQRIKI